MPAGTVTTNGNNYTLGQADFSLTVTNEGPRETYGDMTGQKLLAGIPSGVWTVTDDGGEAGRTWNTLTWNASTTNSSQVQMEVRAADQLSQLANSSFQIVQDSVPLTNVTGEFLQIQVTLVQPAGSTNGPSLHDLTVSCASTNSPSVVITYPANNQRFPYSITNILISATASETGGTITNVTFLNGSTELGATNSTPYQSLWSNVTGGSYTVSARATDSYGHMASNSVGFTVNIPPTVSLISLTNTQAFLGPTNITLVAVATDSDGYVSQVWFYDGTNVLGEVTSGTSNVFSFVWTNAPLRYLPTPCMR